MDLLSFVRSDCQARDVESGYTRQKQDSSSKLGLDREKKKREEKRGKRKKVLSAGTERVRSACSALNALDKLEVQVQCSSGANRK